MIEILTQAAAQVPALVVLCLLVYIFVNSLKAERTAIETIASEALDRNTEAMANNQQVIRAAVDSINRNTEMLGRTLAAVERMEGRKDEGGRMKKPCALVSQPSALVSLLLASARISRVCASCQLRKE